MIIEDKMAIIQFLEKRLSSGDDGTEYEDVAWVDEDNGDLSDKSFDFFESICDEFDNGLSKIVLQYYSEFQEWVFKIPILGEFSWDNPENRREYTGDDNCSRECEIYSYAQDAGIDEFFCPIEYLGTICDFPVYISPKAGTIFESTEEGSNSSKEAKDYSKQDDAWMASGIYPNNLAVFYDWYGKEKVDKFLDFLSMNGIEDCHPANLAYTVSGQPIVIDYGGYSHTE